ncbi:MULTISPECIES: MBL fold metallo-hydrolase [unclassified Kutzneria]|uniref:MBL fold metallo-hydrolase n=1 Tax=unclassified Kutzneria TaxID=2621979 RepID=UPI0003EED88F|nr:MBL fold metallo-hydrolase [Kutzneria sp. 744]EWM17154.1 LigA protein [Kutzneria sp. 744]
MREAYVAAKDVHVLPSQLPIPGAGLLPVNCYLVRGSEPVLVDTGMPIDAVDFAETLWSVVDPADLKWLVLTHDDRDHSGNIVQIMAEAPNAVLVTSQLSVVRLSEEWDLPRDRMLLVNPGSSFTAGDREFSILRPPAFDSPATLAAFDHGSRTLFSADSFGSVLPTVANDVDDVKESDFFEGFSLFNRSNHPWVALTDPAKFEVVLHQIRALGPDRILSSHGPAVEGRVDRLLDAMAEIPTLPMVLPPDQLDPEAVLGRLEFNDQPPVVAAGD